MNRLRNFQIKPIVIQHTGWKSTQPEKLNPEVIVARAGTVVVCPKCKTRIGRLFSDLYSGVGVRADQIEFEQHQKKHTGQKAECAFCRTGYLRQQLVARPNGTIVQTLVSIEINGAQRWI